MHPRHQHMRVLHSVSIPAGFTQCRWSTSGDPSSPLLCKTECLFFPFLPPHSLPHHQIHFYQEVHKMGISNESHHSTPSTSSTFPPFCFLPPPLFLPSPPSPPGGVVICPLSGGDQSPAVWPPHRMTHGGTARLSSPPPSLDQVTRLSPHWLPFPTFSCAILKTDDTHTHNRDETKQMTNQPIAWDFHTVCQRNALVGL